MYEVDKRVGCVAVINTSLKDPDYNGLHDYDKHVVKFWYGDYNDGVWTVSEEALLKAKDICDTLNEQYYSGKANSRTKEQQFFDKTHKSIEEFVMTKVWFGQVGDYLEEYPEDDYLFEKYQLIFDKALHIMNCYWDDFGGLESDKLFAERIGYCPWKNILMTARRKGVDPVEYMKTFDFNKIKQYLRTSEKS